ncbi:LysE family translocator [Prauserella muralis]|uniref:Lysine transporter LysE n=1 Tax=Prauserella muralis TaxID=588067 RepID=A0A2V4AL65_9PSEU|nr:LysE family translocator [Prauserella muralis]PXY20713.1 lysine transporter LysE [Prauserella muralis]TWE29720.1 threonine/homoserine/homoserine lactone efflux protein [Prauserella muralis]
MDLSTFLAFLAAAALISLVPGPDMMFVAAHGMAKGPKAGVVAALGMSTGLAVHTVAAASGLGVLLQAAPAVLDAVRLLGAAFLLYLAWSTLRSARERVKSEADPALGAAAARPLRKTYVMAVLTNLANPKVVLFYLAFFPQFVAVDGSMPVWAQFLVLGAAFIVVGFAVDGSVGLATGTLSALLLRRPSVQRWLDRISAAIFAGLAARLVADQAR